VRPAALCCSRVGCRASSRVSDWDPLSPDSDACRSLSRSRSAAYFDPRSDGSARQTARRVHRPGRPRLGTVGLAISVVKDGRVAKGFGLRALGKSDPVDSATLFAIGSTTKAMTPSRLEHHVRRGRQVIANASGITSRRRTTASTTRCGSSRTRASIPSRPPARCGPASWTWRNGCGSCSTAVASTERRFSQARDVRRAPRAGDRGAHQPVLPHRASHPPALDDLRPRLVPAGLRRAGGELSHEHQQYDTFRIRRDRRWLGSPLLTFVLDASGTPSRVQMDRRSFARTDRRLVALLARSPHIEVTVAGKTSFYAVRGPPCRSSGPSLSDSSSARLRSS
jgi:hypothetical protein